MYFFFADIYGPKSTEDFGTRFKVELMPRLVERRVIAGAWLEEGTGKYMLQGWLDEPEFTSVNEIAGGLGWEAVTRFFSPVFGRADGKITAVFPGPGPTVTFCDMPNNRHIVSSGKPKNCAQGHCFSDNHSIDRCVVCGGQLLDP